MLRNIPQIVFTFVLAAMLCGCQEQSTTPPVPEPEPGLVAGEISPTGPDFEIVIDNAGTPEFPLPGPFVIRGSGLHYDSEQSALVVDLTVRNNGEVAQPEPVSLTFMGLVPADVQVINPDNDEHGPGAAIVFAFANDDNLWTPGETSLPREVRFTVPPGVSIGFFARLGFGPDPAGGVIAGRAWHDLNRNGVLEPGEPGLPGVLIVLQGNIRDCARCIPEAITDDRGFYRFTGLPAGAYVVNAMNPPAWRPTVPTEMHVLLVETAGGVSTFDQADFGFAAPDSLPGVVVPVTFDTVVRTDMDSRRNDNYGCNPILDVGGSRGGGGIPYGGPDGIRSLLYFALPHPLPEPELNSLTGARLEMTIDRYQEGTGQSYELGLYRITEATNDRTPWVEGNGTEFPDGAGSDSTACVWVDPAHGVAWVGAGDGGDVNNQTQPDFAPDPVAVTWIHQNSMGPSAVVSWDVSEVVREWLNGTVPNLGLVLRDPTSDGVQFKSVWFHSREGERLGAGPGPRLVLEFGD